MLCKALSYEVVRLWLTLSKILTTRLSYLKVP